VSDYIQPAPPLIVKILLSDREPKMNTTSLSSGPSVFARFPVGLNLPEPQSIFVDDATEAVRKEYRSSICWKRLRCRKVEPLTGQSGENIFILEVGQSIEFGWTWEGAIAFCPTDPNTFTGNIDLTDDFADLIPSCCLALMRAWYALTSVLAGLNWRLI